MAPLEETRLADLAARLRAAEDDRAPILPLTEEIPELTVADAYRIQQINVHRRKEEGASSVAARSASPRWRCSSSSASTSPTSAPSSPTWWSRRVTRSRSRS